MPITRNRFQNFYERCIRNPQAMKAEMEWIRGPLDTIGEPFDGFIHSPENKRTIERMKENGIRPIDPPIQIIVDSAGVRLKRVEPRKGGYEAPAPPEVFDVKTADYSPRKIVEVEPGEWPCEPRRIDWLTVGVWFAVLVFWGVAAVAWWVR